MKAAAGSAAKATTASAAGAAAGCVPCPVLRAELPGMDPEKDIRITVEGDTLTVSAEHTESKEEKDHSEFRYGFFRRSVRLPARIPPDGVEAAYEDGILTVRVPMRKEPEETMRSIPVKRTATKGNGESS
ncbi:Hsp20/alpha crystallin family protein [Streptomyces sp. NPDC050448]|uniref:Hsp20/alpha crystallin family protein n=1 Tax=Streptomyces sp. NPDC050448 TaxID=3155404 RepID=UPI003429A89C